MKEKNSGVRSRMPWRIRIVGVILLTEKFGREFPDLIDEIKLERTMPLLIEIPDRHGTGRKKDFITSVCK